VFRVQIIAHPLPAKPLMGVISNYRKAVRQEVVPAVSSHSLPLSCLSIIVAISLLASVSITGKSTPTVFLVPLLFARAARKTCLAPASMPFLTKP
jgi:hypothetical protein